MDISGRIEKMRWLKNILPNLVYGALTTLAGFGLNYI